MLCVRPLCFIYFLVGLLCWENVDFQFCVGSVAFCDGFFHAVGSGENHAHASVSFHFWFAEDANVNAWLFKHLIHVFKFHTVAVAFYHDGFTCRWTVEANG